MATVLRSELKLTCWCCGTPFPEQDLVRLGEHPEVTICVSCAHFLSRRAKRVGATAPIRQFQKASDRVRDTVIERGWHERPGIGRLLRWLDKRLPW